MLLRMELTLLKWLRNSLTTQAVLLREENCLWSVQVNSSRNLKTLLMPWRKVKCVNLFFRPSATISSRWPTATHSTLMKSFTLKSWLCWSARTSTKLLPNIELRRLLMLLTDDWTARLCWIALWMPTSPRMTDCVTLFKSTMTVSCFTK